jgi:hypothetical protein
MVTLCAAIIRFFAFALDADSFLLKREATLLSAEERKTEIVQDVIQFKHGGVTKIADRQNFLCRHGEQITYSVNACFVANIPQPHTCGQTFNFDCVNHLKDS